MILRSMTYEPACRAAEIRLRDLTAGQPIEVRNPITVEARLGLQGYRRRPEAAAPVRARCVGTFEPGSDRIAAWFGLALSRLRSLRKGAGK